MAFGDLAEALEASAGGDHSGLLIDWRPVQVQLPLAQAGLQQGAVVRLPRAVNSAAAPSLPPGTDPAWRWLLPVASWLAPVTAGAAWRSRHRCSP